MRTSPEGNDGGSAAPEGAEALLARADTALQEEVLSLLVGPESQERREHLFAIGALPTASSECAAVQEWILTTFREYNECTDEQEETEERARRYQELANLLCLAGIAIPITFRDWKVDRVAEAEQRWGLREGGAALLEELLIEQYAPPAHVRQPARVHLHKGPGNGQLMHHLRTGSRHMEEVGVGDRLYFTIESVLLQYVRPERRGDPIVRQIIATLSQALQGALHERWFEPVSDENGIIQRWQPRGFLCDLNDIFPLLAHPQEWLPNIYKKMMKALYRASEEFEDDRVDMVPHAAQEYIVQLADCEVDYAQAQCQRMQALHSKVIAAMRKGDEQSLEPSIHEFWLITGHMLRDVSSLADLSAKILETLNTEKEVIRQRRMQDSPARKLVDLKQGVDKRVQRLHTLRARISQTSSSADTETLATDFAAIAEHPSLPDGGWTHALLADAVEKEIEECQEQSQGFKRQIQAARKREGEVRDHAQQTASASEKLQEIFTDAFATEITEHEQYEDPEYRKKGVRIDLNRSGPVMHFRQFIPGRFTSTLSQVPSESCLLISASRADSHEPSTPLKGFTGLTINLEDAPGEFEEDVGLTLNLLAPGGVYLTDGHRQSFTRIDRFEEIMRAVKRIIADGIRPEQVDRKLMDSYMDTAGQPYPYPDLIIRTSGEQRTSGILQWQSDYAEMYWEPDHFPDFSPAKLREAILDYSRRRRRFGGNDAMEHMAFKPQVMAKLELDFRRALGESDNKKLSDLVIKYVREQYGLSKGLAKTAGLGMARALRSGQQKDWESAKKALKGLYEVIKHNVGLAFEPELVANIEVNLWRGKQTEEETRQLVAEKYRLSNFQANKSAHLAYLASMETQKGNWERAKWYMEKYYEALKERVA